MGGRTRRERETTAHLLAQVAKLLRERIRVRMEAIGLRRGQGFILRELGEQGGIAQTELAQQSLVRPATLTPVLQRMERAGLVERRPDEADQRISRVYLTAKGEAVRRQAEAIWQELDQELFAGFSEEERAQLRGFLVRIRDGLRHAGRAEEGTRAA
ncbi:MarR family transcriptional regulator [Candidatus Bipolaricaulota bacterium]|nr:MarR family transcriptional regulator [Candidatus Bipolaricaulota bacterium]